MPEYCLWFTADTVCHPAQVWSAWTQGLLSALGIFFAAWLPAYQRIRERRNRVQVAASVANQMQVALDSFYSAQRHHELDDMRRARSLLPDIRRLIDGIPSDQLPAEAIPDWIELRATCAEIIDRIAETQGVGPPTRADDDRFFELNQRLLETMVRFNANSKARALKPRR